jgi:hypothetical protein
LEFTGRLGQFARFSQRYTQADARFDKVGLLLDRALIFENGTWTLALFLEQTTKVVPRLQMGRLDLERLFKMADGAAGVLLLREEASQIGSAPSAN